MTRGEDPTAAQVRRAATQLMKRKNGVGLTTIGECKELKEDPERTLSLLRDEKLPVGQQDSTPERERN